MSSPSEAINDPNHDFSIQLSALNSSLTNTMSTLSYNPSREKATVARHVWTLSIPHHSRRIHRRCSGRLIAVTYTSNSTALDRATNWFGFVGLTLDVVGVCAGSLTLFGCKKPSITRTALLCGSLAQSTARAEMRRSCGRSRISQSLQVSLQVISDRAYQDLQPPVIGFDSDSHKRYVYGNFPDPQVPHFMSNILDYVIKHSFHGPAVSLTGGTLCLLISVILFAGASQPLFICISCITITMSMIVLSIPSTKADKQMRAVYDRVEKELPEYLRVNASYQDPQGRDA
ncbi:hypothetical protein BGW80DRAFT_100073 [Lactifluus volemus]|nr:hypothetical protein BGW80DRAFT_100073 [Lactifluus volemus]